MATGAHLLAGDTLYGGDSGDTLLGGDGADDLAGRAQHDGDQAPAGQVGKVALGGGDQAIARRIRVAGLQAIDALHLR